MLIRSSKLWTAQRICDRFPQVPRAAKSMGDPLAQLDPEQRAWIEWRDSHYALPHVAPTTPQQIRENIAARTERSSETVGSIQDLTIPGPPSSSGEATQLPIRIIRPHGTQPNELLPALVWFHGGCWFLNSIDQADPLLRRLANVGRRFCIVAVEYRLAPEHKFPAGLEDCYAATAWVSAHAAEIGVLPGAVGVGGDSCGGNLAVAVAMLAKERQGPHLALQMLLYPMADHPSANFPSITRNDVKLLGFTRALDEMGWALYGACDPPHGTPERPNILAALLQAPDLTGLPPAHVLVAELDVVRDEGEALAVKLRNSGVPVTFKEYSGCMHVFLHLAVAAETKGQSIKAGHAAIQDVADVLNTMFDTAATNKA